MAAVLECASNDDKEDKDDDTLNDTEAWTKRDRFIALCMHRIDALESQVLTLATLDSGWLLPKPNRASSTALCSWQLLMTASVFDNLATFKSLCAKQLCRVQGCAVVWLYVQHNVVSGHDELQCECIMQFPCAKYSYQVVAGLTRTFAQAPYTLLPVSYEDETDCGLYNGRVVPICTDVSLAKYRKLFHKATVLQTFPNLKWMTNKNAWLFGGKYSSSGKRLSDEVTARELQQSQEWQVGHILGQTFDDDSRPLYVLDALNTMEAKAVFQRWGVPH